MNQHACYHCGVESQGSRVQFGSQVQCFEKPGVEVPLSSNLEVVEMVLRRLSAQSRRCQGQSRSEQLLGSVV